MAVSKVLAILFITNIFCLWLSSSLSQASENDVNCLKSIKSQFQDPYDYLSSWVFDNYTLGYICKFSGVSCWHDDENRVLSIKLAGFGLEGEFPVGIKECSAMVSLDLSRNNLSGTLPSDIAVYISQVTTLNLSFNKFSGHIPSALGNCSYLNTLALNDNQFTGQIPPELALLGRLKQFSVVNNRLTGPVPNFNSFTNASYDNNPGLCDGPLASCLAPPEGLKRMAINGAAVGAAIFAPIGAGYGCFCFNRKEKQRQRRISSIRNQ